MKPDFFERHARLKSRYPSVILLLLLGLLTALIVLALAVCPTTPLVVLPAVPVATMRYPFAQIVHAKSHVAVGFARDTARSGRAEDEDWDGKHRGCRMCGRRTCDGGRNGNDRAVFAGGR